MINATVVFSSCTPVGLVYVAAGNDLLGDISVCLDVVEGKENILE